VGWRQARLLGLLRLFVESVQPRGDPLDEELKEYLREKFGPREAAGEPQYQELLRLLDEEIAGVREQLEEEEKANERRVAIAREAALAPVGEVWNHLVRQEAALDRSIDRKVRILLAMRKEFAAGNIPVTPPEEAEDMTLAGLGDASPPGLAPEGPQPVEATENTNLNERSLNVVENKGQVPEADEGSSDVAENKGKAPEAGEGSSDVAEKSGTCVLAWGVPLSKKGVNENEGTSEAASNDNLSCSDPAPSAPSDRPLPPKQ